MDPTGKMAVLDQHPLRAPKGTKNVKAPEDFKGINNIRDKI